jgi:uncharacterized protein
VSDRVRAVIAVVCVGVLFVGLLWAGQRRLIYLPSGSPPPVEQAMPGAQEVTLTTGDGLALSAWWRAAGPTAVIVLPGNAGNRAGRVPLADALQAQGLSVLLVDYRGYGGNPGSPTEEGLLADARAAVTWTRSQAGVGRVVLFGESLGSGVAVGVAADDPPDALVLRSPFTSLLDVARTHYGPVPGWLLRDRYPSIDRIPDVDAPILIVAGDHDEIIPHDQSRRLAEVAGARLVTVPGARHNDRELFDGDVLIDAVAVFLRDHDLR